MNREKQYWNPSLTVFKDWQIPLLDYAFAEGAEFTSRNAYDYMNDYHPSYGISRASVINFLNGLVCEGLLSYTEGTGKGGVRLLYSPTSNLKEALLMVWEKLNTQISDEFKRILGTEVRV